MEPCEDLVGGLELSAECQAGEQHLDVGVVDGLREQLAFPGNQAERAEAWRKVGRRRVLTQQLDTDHHIPQSDRCHCIGAGRSIHQHPTESQRNRRNRETEREIMRINKEIKRRKEKEKKRGKKELFSLKNRYRKREREYNLSCGGDVSWDGFENDVAGTTIGNAGHHSVGGKDWMVVAENGHHWRSPLPC